MSEKSLMGNIEVLKLSNEESNKLTLECLEQALIILMDKKPYNKITITEIVKKAGVSRTAFYRNYNSKEDIIQKYLTESVDSIYTLMELQYNENKDYEYWLTMFEALVPHMSALRILFHAHFYENLENGLFTRIISDYVYPTMKDKCFAKFWSGAITSILNYWVMEASHVAPKDMAQYLCDANQFCK